MKVLVIGGGGREHAITQALSRAGSVSEVLASPGNPGMAEYARLIASPQTPQALTELAVREAAQLVIVGPEAPLAQGVVDALTAANIPAFGPTQAAARIEGDKTWSKAFMLRHGIPTAAHRSFADLDEALSYARKSGAAHRGQGRGPAGGQGRHHRPQPRAGGPGAAGHLRRS